MAPYTFQLFAPYNKQAGLRLKNANARMFGLDIPMEFDDKDGHWRVTLDLVDGVYHYQFKVITRSWFEKEPEPALPFYTPDETKTMEENERIRKSQQEEYEKEVNEIRERNEKRAEQAKYTDLWYTFVDPYATDVDERGSDGAHKAVGILVMKNGRRIVDEYEWKWDNHVPLMPNEQLIIYELHIGDFKGRFKDVTENIDYFVKLGITAVEIMPIKEFPGSVSWGYTPRYHFAVETSYGPTYELKEMIDTFHKNGIRVIIDGVYNHSDVSAPYTAIDHDYWFRHEPKDRVWCWGPEWDYDKYDEKFDVWPARKYIGESIYYFVNEFHIDGIRFDAATQIANDKFLAIVTEQSHQQAKDRGFAPNFYCVGEYLPDEPHHVKSNDGPMDGCWHDTLYYKLRDAIILDKPNWEELKNGIDGRRRGYKNIVDLVNYQSNHDHDRVLVDLGKERQIFDKDAFRRVQMALAVYSSSFGLMMMWMGSELGEYKERTQGQAKIDWSLIEDRPDNSNAINKEHLQYCKDVIHLRKSNPAMISPNLEFIFENIDDQIMAWHRWTDPSENQNVEQNHVVIVCNWSNDRTFDRYEITGMPCNGSWYEWLNNDQEYNVQNGTLVIESFIDHTARFFIYRKKKNNQSN